MNDNFNDNNDYNFENGQFSFDYVMPEVENNIDCENHQIYKAPKQKASKNIVRDIFDWLDVMVASIIAVVIIFTFIFRIAAIDGDSMQNTLFHGERVVITNMFYTPKQGDVVVISRNMDNSATVDDNEMPIIKRVIATEGQIVDINFETGEVKVDGNVLKEDYIKELTHRKLDINFPVRVDENCVFVMGDNRNNSLDSRSSQIGVNGMVNEKYIMGHAILRIFPFNKIGTVK